MKFAKLMCRAEELLPDLRHLCIRYKELKKCLRNARPSTDVSDHMDECECADVTSKAETDFLEMLREDVQKLNDCYCEKEEEVIILLQNLDEQAAAAGTPREYQLCHVGYIHLHGQLVMLFHWSMLNYTALIKILKKHDKVSGVQFKGPLLSSALKQPFSKTGLLTNLMKKCSSKAAELESVTGGLDSLLHHCPQYKGLFLIRETEAALDVWDVLRQNASTPSTFLQSETLHALCTSYSRKRKISEDPADTNANMQHACSSGPSVGQRSTTTTE